jgi:hypothetical protein
MSVTLPAHEFQDVAYIPLDFGGSLSPPLGGPEQRLNRLGNRTAVRITTKPLANAAEGRIFFQRLMRGRSEGVITTLPQSGLDVGSPGSPVVATGVSGGSALGISGLSSGYVLREGQPLSIIHSGRRYLHFVDADTASSGGAATISITPMIRVALTAGDTIELALPMIEGALEGDPVAWERSSASVASFTYVIREIA